MTHWRQAAFAVIDLETTGLDPRHDEVLSVGVVHIEGGVIDVASAFYSLVRPLRLPDTETIVVHGIRPADLQDAPGADEVATRVRQVLAGRLLVAHVARIEEGFLSQWLGPDVPGFIDTDVLMRLHLARARGVSMPEHTGLGAAAQWFGLPEHQRHHALGDALTTAQLFLALATASDVSVQQMQDAERALRREHRKLRRGRLLSRMSPQKKETQ